MNNHLSEDQIANYILGRVASAERRHVEECAECETEIQYFANAIASFRSAVGDRVDAHAPRPMRDKIAVTPSRVLAFAVSVTVMVMTLTFIGQVRQPVQTMEPATTRMEPDDLMQAVNMHLAQTVPAPMEPVMPFISTKESLTESGGVR